MTDRETLEKAADLLDGCCPRGTCPGLAIAARLREMAAVSETCAEEANNYCRILSLLGMEEEGDPTTGVAALQARIAELEPLQEVAAQLEDEKRVLIAERDRLREALEAWRSAENYPEPSCSAEYDYQGRLYTHARRLTAAALKENDGVCEEPGGDPHGECTVEITALRSRIERLLAVGEMLAAVTQGAKEEFVRVPYGASHEDVSAINEWHGMADQAMTEWEALKENDK